MSLSNLPNLICILRVVLAVPVVWTLVHGHFGATLLLFAAAAASDGLDGYLAKRFGWTSEAGKVLDPVADKLLLVSVFIALTLLGMVPLWLAFAVVARDLVIGVGAGVYRWLFGPLEGQPTQPSKLNTVLQLAYVLAVVASAATPVFPAELVIMLGAAVLVTTVVSGADYVIIYVRKAMRVSQARRLAA
ncbi:MAG: CDP-diacylglycerol--glycerol-3-phosphate 3-phosphatidyltransferase [Proteobacteria bacterium]|nr:CDP-diacylglycerol--glycerol-3-phosphate 3-phosphatidyltransferase [Pseudomonadota bacterium]